MTRLILAAPLLALGLAACGIKDGLERPPPLWGDARAEYKAQAPEAKPAETAASEEVDADDVEKRDPVIIQPDDRGRPR